MRKKEKKLVLTFATTTAAMKMEKTAKERALPGRLIPVPVQIHAGCGLAFCTDCDQKIPALQMMEENGIEWEGLDEVAL